MRFLINLYIRHEDVLIDFSGIGAIGKPTRESVWSRDRLFERNITFHRLTEIDRDNRVMINSGKTKLIVFNLYKS